PSVGVGGPDLELCEWDGGELDVLDVGAGEVQTSDGGTLQRPRGATGVTAGRDGGALLQGGAVRHRSANGQLGCHVDVGEPSDAAPAEQGPGAPALPDDRRVDDGAALDRLERVYLPAGIDCGLLAAQRLA